MFDHTTPRKNDPVWYLHRKQPNGFVLLVDKDEDGIIESVTVRFYDTVSMQGEDLDLPGYYFEDAWTCRFTGGWWIERSECGRYAIVFE